VGVFTVGNLSVEKNRKLQGLLQVANSELTMPVTLINGSREGKTVVITSGIHGGEYPGIEAAIRLGNELMANEVIGQIALVHPANVAAFQTKMQYNSPLDGKNLNRMFPGKALGTTTERIAYTISTELFSQADFYMDLHGGDIHEALVQFVLYPAGAGEDIARVSREAAALLGVPYVVGSYSSNGTFGCAATMGVPGFLGEIGHCGLWTEEEVVKYMQGVKNILKHLGVLAGEPESVGPVQFVPRMIGLNAEQSGCWYPSVSPGDTVKQGQKLGEIRDYFGKTLGEYFASQDATVLYVISSLAIMEGEPIVAIG
jgi:predicted deacylase